MNVNDVALPPVLPETESRHEYAWPLLYTVFGLLISLAILSSFTKTKSDAANYQDIDQSLKIHMAMRLDPMLPSAAKAASKADALIAVRDKLDKVKDSSDEKLFRQLVLEYETDPKKIPTDWLNKQKPKTLLGQKAVEAYKAPQPVSAVAGLQSAAVNHRWIDRMMIAEMKEKSGDLVGAQRMFNGVAVRTMAGGTGFILVILIGVIAASVFLFYLSGNKVHFQGFTQPNLSPGQQDVYALRALMVMGALIFSQFIPQQYSFVRLAVTALGMILSLKIPIGGQTVDLKQFYGSKIPLHRAALTGWAGNALSIIPILILFILYLLVQRFLPDATHPAQEEIFAHPTTLNFVIFGLSAVVIAPILEETIFRGLILNSLASRMHPVKAIAISSFLFAAIHPQGIGMWLVLATVGAAAASVHLYSKSLIPSMILHATHNGFLFLLAVLQVL